ncbi:MAG: hypothetical protein ABI905_13160 [Betaproteobacteria bacterium]
MNGQLPIMRLVARILAVLLATSVFMNDCCAAGNGNKYRTKENLLVQLRPFYGEALPNESFVKLPSTTMEIPGGSKFELDLASWKYIGDISIEFIFQEPDSPVGALQSDLVKIGLARPEDALPIAIANLRRINGEAKITEVTGGLMRVRGTNPDLDSAYFLDRALWKNLESRYPEGILVSVTQIDSLLFAPLSQQKAAEYLMRSANHSYRTGTRPGVSGLLYLFKNGKWTAVRAK